MGRAPCCEKVGLKKGRWTTEEDELLAKYIQANGEGHWRSLPKNAGLLRCGKSCRLRWINYLRADIKRGNISSEEENTILKLHASFGNRWSLIASHLEGRTDNEIKNYWNSHLSRKIYSLKGTPVPPKRKGGRTSRWAMKKNKSYTTQNVHTPKQTPSLSKAVTGEAVDDDILGLCQLESINEGGGELDMLERCGVWDLSEENDVVVNNADACLNKTSSTSTHSIASVNGECGEWNSSCSSNAITVGLDPHWDWESFVEFNHADHHNTPPSWEHQQKLLAWLWEDDDDFQSDGVETYLHTQNDIDDWILS